jgi:hypothetical protein
MELIGIYLVGCVLLASAGASKALRPDNTARALAPLVSERLRPHLQFVQMRMIIRLVSVLEVGLGVTAAVLPRPVFAGLVAASYLGFAAIVFFARSRGGALASCGCFGTPDTPATALHVFVDLGLAMASLAFAIFASARATLLSVLGPQPLHGLPLVFLTGVGTWLTYLTLSMLAALQAARMTIGSPAGRR